jgi:hypothetical protein
MTDSVTALPAHLLSKAEFMRQQFVVDLADWPDTDRPTEEALLAPGFWRNFGPNLNRGDEITIRRLPLPEIVLIVDEPFTDGGVRMRRADQLVTAQGRTHFAICRQSATAPESFTLLTHSGDRWANGWAGSTDLRSIVGQLLPKFPGKTSDGWPDLTITHRAVIDVLAMPPPATPDELADTEPGATVQVLAPIGGSWPDDLWCSMVRFPTGDMIPGEKFRTASLQNEVLKFFFAGEPRQMGREARYKTWAKTRIDQGGRDILLVRPDWRLTHLLPDAWPPPKPIFNPVTPEIADQAERLAAAKQAKETHRRQMQQRGYTWSDRTRSWKPPRRED